MAVIRHNLPVFIALGLLFFTLGFVVMGAFLWQRVGILRASVLGALIIWGGLVLALTLSPKRRYRGELALPRSCDVAIIPDHLLGAVTNVARIEVVLVFVPLGALLVLGARGMHRLVIGLVLVVLPFVIESVQYALPALRRTCSSTDIYDSWTGMVLGLGTGAVLLVTARHSKFATDRAARHRQPEQRPPNPLDVVRVLWPPHEDEGAAAARAKEATAAAARAEVLRRSTFIPSGAKPAARPAPTPAREPARPSPRQAARRAREAREAQPPPPPTAPKDGA
jgi:hypothetical protein